MSLTPNEVVLVCVGLPGHVSSCCAGGVEDPDGPCAGDREANRWLQYDSRDLPWSQERWDALCYVEKTHWGYCCWPRYRGPAWPGPAHDLAYAQLASILLCLNHSRVSFVSQTHDGPGSVGGAPARPAV